MKTQSLANQFRRTFIIIAALSMVTTFLVYALAGYLFGKSLNKYIYPANYYEQQIPYLEKFITGKNTLLLSPSGEDTLKNMIRGDGIDYQVTDNRGNILYGTESNPMFESTDELFSSFLNTTVFRNGHYIYTVPLTDTAGEPAGTVILSYQIKMTVANGWGWFIITVLAVALLSPFLSIAGYTLLFSRIFAQNINHPLQLLVDASNKIREKDLDFEIGYCSDNELGRLCIAFSEMKEELRKSLSTQWKMEQERIEMAEAMAHDLKSPLSIILGCSDALLESSACDEEKRVRYLTVIKENAEKSADLVREMQYISDIEQSNIELHPVCINLPEFLEHKVHDYELQARQKQIHLELKMNGSMQSPCQIDVNRLSRILDNIISNSLQYTPAGGMIRITAAAEEGRIRYEICDTGNGFDSKDLKKALDKFYRGDESRQTRNGHSGLGLYIVRQLTEQMGGSVQISNKDTGGASVTFWHRV